MARRLQADAVGTIREVFQRIQKLSADERISVISDLFGDEAKGLTQLVNNLPALEKALFDVAERYKYAGSMTKEYAVQSQTTANQLKLAQNQFTNLGIVIGAAVLPALTKLLEVVTPAVAAVMRFAEANPAITGVVVGVTALAAAFILAAPFIAATISVLTTLSGLGLAATIAGWAGAVVPFLIGLKGIIATAAAVVAGFIT